MLESGAARFPTSSPCGRARTNRAGRLCPASRGAARAAGRPCDPSCLLADRRSELSWKVFACGDESTAGTVDRDEKLRALGSVHAKSMRHIGSKMRLNARQPAGREPL